MSWDRYPKIAHKAPESLAPNVVDGEWVVTEKLHGANFSVLFDGEAVRFAKRSGILPDAEDFYSFRSQRLDADLSAAVRRLWRIVGDRTAGPEGLGSLVVYGELLGGHYPHPDVVTVAGLRPVQRGVWYAPGLHFVAFDLAVAAPGSLLRFLDFSLARAAVEEAGFMFVEPMRTGSYADVAHTDIRFQSTFPQRLGLPQLPSDNFAEGVVIRPALEPARTNRRALIKMKIPEFAETQMPAHADWREARAGKPGTHAHNAAQDQELTTRYEALAVVTPQRLDNVLSKRGRVDPQDREACRTLLKEFVEDILAALVEDEVVASSDQLSPETREAVRSSAREVIAQHFRQEYAARKLRADAGQQQLTLSASAAAALS